MAASLQVVHLAGGPASLTFRRPLDAKSCSTKLVPRHRKSRARFPFRCTSRGACVSGIAAGSYIRESQAWPAWRLQAKAGSPSGSSPLEDTTGEEEAASGGQHTTPGMEQSCNPGAPDAQPPDDERTLQDHHDVSDLSGPTAGPAAQSSTPPTQTESLQKQQPTAPAKHTKQSQRVANYNLHAGTQDMATRARSTADGLYQAAVEGVGTTRRAVPYRRLREALIVLRTSPFLAVWLLIGMGGVMVYFSELQGASGNGPWSPLLLVASVLGVTATKAKAGAASASAVSTAWGATWRASGAAGILSFYLRSVLAGKRLRIVRYPGEGPAAEEQHSRMTTMTVWNASARLLRERIARKNGFFASDIHMFHWINPGVFEYIPEDGDLMLVPESGYIVWAPIEVSVPVKGPLYPESKQKPALEAGLLEALLLDIADIECDQETEARLAELALAGDDKLRSVHAAFGAGKDSERFAMYALALLRVNETADCD
mmetsp:Transcript_30054/g.84824  ORF Transcript_30054/g.84824 Transcript_30054/m.84824 type:complete len:486 (+) Transcript_30054:100-1557(+)